MVERHLAKVNVASSNLVFRSINPVCLRRDFFIYNSSFLAYCLLNLAGGYFNLSPAFIWHACGDKVVRIEHSLEYATELHKKGINAEVHIFPDGKHGMGLTQKSTPVECHISQWADLLLKWFGYIEWSNNCDIMNVTENKKDVLINRRIEK